MFFNKPNKPGENYMFSMELLGANIMKYRKAAGMTQMELADRMGISFQAVSNWERGISAPDISKLSELSSMFGVSVDEIIGNKRMAKIVNDIEFGDTPDLKADEIAEIAPILSQKQADAVTEESSDIDIGKLASVAPFVSDEFLDGAALKKYRETGDINSIKPILPFISEDVLGDIADEIMGGSTDLSLIRPIMPFMDDDKLDALALKVYEERGIGAIVSAAPFLSDDVMTLIAVKVLKRDGIAGVRSILPFIDEEIIEKYVMGNLS